MWLNRLTVGLRPLWKRYWRLTVEPEKALPAAGEGVLLAANHTSFLDPWFLAFAMPRPLRFVITRNWYEKSRAWNVFFRANGTIPVEAGDPEGTLSSVRVALARGDCVGIFPEGRISADGHILRFRSGLSFIAARTGAPVVPVGVRGAFEVLPRTRRWPKPGEIVFTVGPPLVFPGSPRDDLPTHRELAEFRDGVRAEIARLSGQTLPARVKTRLPARETRLPVAALPLPPVQAAVPEVGPLPRETDAAIV